MTNWDTFDITGHITHGGPEVFLTCLHPMVYRGDNLTRELVFEIEVLRTKRSRRRSNITVPESVNMTPTSRRQKQTCQNKIDKSTLKTRSRGFCKTVCCGWKFAIQLILQYWVMPVPFLKMKMRTRWYNKIENFPSSSVRPNWGISSNGRALP